MPHRPQPFDRSDPPLYPVRPGAGGRWRAGVWALAALAGGLVLLGAVACGGTDEAERALRLAQIELDLISAGGGSRAPRTVDAEELRGATPEQRADLRDAQALAGTRVKDEIVGETRKRLQSVVAHANKAAGSSSPGLSAAGRLLAARAQAELAKLDSERAGELGTGLRLLSDRCVRLLAGWRRAQTMAVSYAAQDVSEEIRAAERRIADLRTRIAEAQRGREALEAQRAEYLRAAEQAAQAARAARAELPAIRAGATSETDRLERERRAAEAGRRADAHDRQAAEAAAQAQQVEPLIADAVRQIESSEREVQLWTSTRTALESRARDARESAESARRLAAANAAEFGVALDELRARLGEVLAASTAAERSFREALANARAAAQAHAGTRGGADALTAVTQQLLGALLLDRADALSLLQGALTLARAEVAHGLPNPVRPEDESLAERIRQTRAEGREALQSALQIFAGMSGPSQELAEAARQRLERLAEGDHEAVVATPRTGSMPGPVAAPTPAGTADGPEVAELREALRRLQQQSERDPEAALRFMHATTPTEQAFLSSMRPLMTVQGRLNRLCREKFGVSYDQIAARALPGATMGGSLDFMADVDQYTLTPEGPGRIRGTHRDMPGTTMTFVKVGGEWKMAMPPEISQLPPEAAGMMQGMIGMLTGPMNALADDLEAGRVTTQAQVEQRIRQMLQGLMGGMGGMGGGGMDFNK
jgi:hypothetical protein